MPACLVIVEKTLAGETWENTHCAIFGPNGADAITDAALTALGGDIPLSAANTASGAPVNLLQAIVGFERQCHQGLVSITRVYVTDGKRNRLGNTVYMTQDVALAGYGDPTVTQAVLAPGSITLQVNRNPIGHSRRPGRLFLRGALVEGAIRFGAARMVDWENTTLPTTWAGYLNTWLTNSKLNTYFGASTDPAAPKYAIARYHHDRIPLPPPNLEGMLIDATPVGSMSLVGPVARQTNRGRKRRASSGTTAV